MPYDVTPASRFEKAIAGTLADPASREEKALMGQLADPSNRLEALVNARASGGGGGVTVQSFNASGNGTGTITFPLRLDTLPDDGLFALVRGSTNTTGSGTRTVLWGMIRRSGGAWVLDESTIYTIYRLTSSVTFGMINPGISDIRYEYGSLIITTASTESAEYVFSQTYLLIMVS